MSYMGNQGQSSSAAKSNGKALSKCNKTKNEVRGTTFWETSYPYVRWGGVGEELSTNRTLHAH